MSRAFVVVALLALAGSACALPLSADSVTDVFAEWHSSLEEQAVAEHNGRGLLQTDLYSILSEISTAQTSVQTFLSSSLGSTWRNLVPTSWADANFNWTSLRSELSAVNASQLSSEATQFYGKFHHPEKFTPGVKPDPDCAGPLVKLSYVPKKCIFTKDFKSITCAPANVTLTRIPGECTFALDGISTYVGKEIYIEKVFGEEATKVKGGAEYPIALKPLKSVLKDGAVALKTGLDVIKEKKKW